MHIFDRLFPWFMDNVFGKGFRPEVARAAKQCHVGLIWGPENQPHMCKANDCMSWKWNRSKFNWRELFTKRRGNCAHTMRWK